jgi:hypothetical protein
VQKDAYVVNDCEECKTKQRNTTSSEGRKIQPETETDKGNMIGYDRTGMGMDE